MHTFNNALREWELASHHVAGARRALALLTRTFELLVVQVRHVLALQLGGRLAAGVGGEAGGAAQEAGQPGQMAVAGERVVGQPQRPQPPQTAEDVVGQRRQVVVVQRAEMVGVIMFPFRSEKHRFHRRPPF